MTFSRAQPFEEYVLDAFSLAYVEILEEKEYHSVTLDGQIPEIAKKREEIGIGNTYPFFHYRVRIIQDARGKIPSGTVAYMSVPIMYEYYTPVIRVGDRLVLPLSEDEFWEGNYQFTTKAIYYVTESGHLMSAFFENFEETPRTGQYFSTLLREFE